MYNDSALDNSPFFSAGFAFVSYMSVRLNLSALQHSCWHRMMRMFHWVLKRAAKMLQPAFHAIATLRKREISFITLLLMVEQFQPPVILSSWLIDLNISRART